MCDYPAGIVTNAAENHTEKCLPTMAPPNLLSCHRWAGLGVLDPI